MFRGNEKEEKDIGERKKEEAPQRGSMK